MQVDGNKKPFEIIKISKQQLKGQWSKIILVCFICKLISLIISIVFQLNFKGYTYYYKSLSGYSSINTNTYLSMLIVTIITAPLALALANYFIVIARGQKADFRNFSSKLKDYGPAFSLVIIRTAIVILYGLLLIIPGIWIYLRYSQALYILNDYPGLSSMEALKMSKDMMKGHVSEYISMFFLFIGWYWLVYLVASIIASSESIIYYIVVFIGLVALEGYMDMATANFYENLKIAGHQFESAAEIDNNINI